MLDRFTNLCMIAASLAFCIYVGGVMLRSGPPSATPAYRIGDKLEGVDGLRFTDRPTLVLYVSSTCEFCTSSMGFYKTLVDKSREGSLPVRIVGLARESQESLRRYFAANGVVDIDAVTTGSTTMSFKGTPTLLLVNTEGRVAQIWEGLLSNTRQDEVMRALAARNPS